VNSFVSPSTSGGRLSGIDEEGTSNINGQSDENYKHVSRHLRHNLHNASPSPPPSLLEVTEDGSRTTSRNGLSDEEEREETTPDSTTRGYSCTNRLFDDTYESFDGRSALNSGSGSHCGKPPLYFANTIVSAQWSGHVHGVEGRQRTSEGSSPDSTGQSLMRGRNGSGDRVTGSGSRSAALATAPARRRTRDSSGNEGIEN